jgi:hypothetical protein
MRQASYGVTAVLASVLALAPSAWAADDATALLIGNAGGLSGQVLLAAAAIDADRRPVGRQIGSGDPIYQGDQIATGPGGRLQLMLLDQTIITLGENARMTIDDISFGPTAADGKISVGVEQGAFRFISGQVAQAKPENVNIRIPMGTIGIRGTIVGGIVTPNSTLVALLGPGGQTNSSAARGAIAVTTPGGSVDITRTGFSTVLTPGQPPTPPVLLTPAQIQLLTAPPALSTALPPPPATPTSGGGSMVTGTPETPLSASTVSGSATASGLQFANVISRNPAPPAAITTVNLIGNAAVADIDQRASRTLAQSVGTALPYTLGTNYRTLQDIAWSTGTDTDHAYSLITSDAGATSFSYTSNGVRLTSFDSNPVSLATFSYDFDTKIRTYSSNETRFYYDHSEKFDLIYSAYGYFTDSRETDSTHRQYAYTAIGTGLPTPSVQMPSSGSATYSGGTVGYVAIGNGVNGISGNFSGSATLTANFSSRSISGTLSGLTPSSSLASAGVSMGDITLSNATISGSGFSGGTVSGTVTKTSTSTATGTFAGGFNGTKAAEVAGTYAMSNASSQVSVVGSFGAKK